MYSKPRAANNNKKKKKSLDVRAPLTLTSTVDSFVVAVVAIFRPVAQLVEVDAFFCPDALYVVEGTSDHHLLCT